MPENSGFLPSFSPRRRGIYKTDDQVQGELRLKAARSPLAQAMAAPAAQPMPLARQATPGAAPSRLSDVFRTGQPVAPPQTDVLRAGQPIGPVVNETAPRAVPRSPLAAAMSPQGPNPHPLEATLSRVQEITGALKAGKVAPGAPAATPTPGGMHASRLREAMNAGTPGLPTNAQAATIQQQTGFQPNVTVGGNFGQSHLRNALGIATPSAPIPRDYMGRDIRPALEASDRIQAAFASRDARRAATRERQMSEADVSADRTGLAMREGGRIDYDPETNTVYGRGRAAPSRTPLSEAVMGERRAAVAASRAESRKSRFAQVVENAQRENAAREKRIAGPTMEERLAARSPLAAVALAGQRRAETSANADRQNKIELANIGATAQKDIAKAQADVAKADREHELAVKSGDREAAAKAQENLLAAQERMNKATVDAQAANTKATQEGNAGRDKLAALVGLVGAGMDPKQAQGLVGGQNNAPQTPLQRTMDPSRTRLGGVATDTDVAALEERRDRPEDVRAYMQKQMGLNGPALTQAIQRFYGDDTSRLNRTADNPGGDSLLNIWGRYAATPLFKLFGRRPKLVEAQNGPPKSKPAATKRGTPTPLDNYDLPLQQ